MTGDEVASHLSSPERLLAAVEWDYTRGNSFAVGEADVLRFMLEHGWTVKPPPGWVPYQWDHAWDDPDEG
jgi:hypothetical protein